MKKLLNILGSLSITILPVTSIVSCKTKNDGSETIPNIEDKDEKPDFASLIADFKKDVSNIISEELNETREKLFELEENAKQKNKFLNEENIKKKSENKNLDDKEKQNLEYDIKLILSIDNIKNKLDKLKDKVEYNVILEGLDNIYKNIEIDFDNIDFRYKSLANQEEQQTLKSNYYEEKNDFFTSNVIVDFSIVTNYKDQTNQVAEYKITSKFVYSLTSDKDLVNFGTNSIKNLQNKYFLSEKESSVDGIWLDAKGLDLSENDGLLLENNNNIQNYFKKKEFGDNFLSYIKKEALENSKNPFIKKLNISLDNLNAFSKLDWKVKLENKTTTKYEWRDESGNGKTMYNEIFKNNIVQEERSLAGNNTKVNRGLYNYISKESNGWLNKYKDGINEFAKANNIDFGDKDLSSTSKLGYVYLKGLRFQIDDYIQELPEIKLLTGYSINKEEKNWESDRFKSIDQSKTLTSIYNNAKKGIEAYVKTFGIVKKDNDNILATFSGKTPNLATNLWKTIEKQNGLSIAWINSSLSLKNDENDVYNQKQFRDILLKEGNQETFSWRFIKNSFNMVFNFNDSGLVYEFRRWQSGRYTIETGVDNLEINFTIDFVNITFNVDKIWRSRETTTFIEKQR